MVSAQRSDHYTASAALFISSSPCNNLTWWQYRQGFQKGSAAPAKPGEVSWRSGVGSVTAIALQLLCFLGRLFCNLPGPCVWKRVVTPSSPLDVAADLPHLAVIASAFPEKHPADGDGLDYPFIPAIPLLLAASSLPAYPPNHTPVVPTSLTHNPPPRTSIKPVSSQPCFPSTPCKELKEHMLSR